MNIIIKTKKMTCATFFMLLCPPLFASVTSPELPRGCHDEGYSFTHKSLTLMPSKAGKNDSVYFIYNNSEQTLNLFQLKSEKENMGLNINNKIEPFHWGVYSTDESLVRFACSVPSPVYDHGQLINCQKALNVCEYTNVKYGLNNRGNYWMSRSNTKNGALKRVNRLGVLLPN